MGFLWIVVEQFAILDLVRVWIRFLSEKKVKICQLFAHLTKSLSLWNKKSVSNCLRYVVSHFVFSLFNFIFLNSTMIFYHQFLQICRCFSKGNQKEKSSLFERGGGTNRNFTSSSLSCPQSILFVCLSWRDFLRFELISVGSGLTKKNHELNWNRTNNIAKY